MRYYPFGETRYGGGGLPTDRRFTGQAQEAAIGLYYYGARWYDPSLNRFISADTMVPSPGNPQSLNRYAYTLGNPLRFVDPTGHFTDDAITTYLKEQYGDDWERHWKTWQADDAWMKLLHGAQGNDVLYRASVDSSGNPKMDYFKFAGSGHDVLSGASQLMGKDWSNSKSVSLQDVYSSRGQGMGGIHYESNGDIVNLGTVGGIHAKTYKVSEDEVTAKYVVLYLAEFLIGTEGGPLMWIGGAAGLVQTVRRKDVDNLPGMKEGDNGLTISFSTPMWAYQYDYIFRNGENISYGCATYLYTPHVNRPN